LSFIDKIKILKGAKMKKYYVYLLLIFFLLTNLAESGKLRIDVKTHLIEKIKLRAIKEGVIYYLKESGFEIVEKGEDYVIWLKDYYESREFIDKYVIRIKLKFTYPSAFIEKPAIYEKTENITFKYSPELIDIDETGLWKYLKKKIDDIKKKDMIKSHFVGRKIAYDIYFLFKDGIVKDKRFKPVKNVIWLKHLYRRVK
jgi:hypothetical protein